MQAIVRTGGKQYQVAEGDVLTVEKIEGDVGSEVILDEVLMVNPGGEAGDVKIGTPVLEDFKVKGEIIDQGRGKKITVFTYKRRKRYKRKMGHRQLYTKIRVMEILGPAKKKKKKPAPKKAAEKPPEEIKEKPAAKEEVKKPVKEKAPEAAEKEKPKPKPRKTAEKKSEPEPEKPKQKKAKSEQEKESPAPEKPKEKELKE